MRMRLLAVSTAFIFLASQCALALPAHAAVADWIKGVNLTPNSSTDFGSASFDQSLKNLAQTGTNSVAFLVPYYQSNTGSTDIGPGWNTPTDASLASAIDYAHSLGLSVAIKFTDDPYTGDWRAHINPSDRNGWFAAYASALDHVASIAQAHHVELIIIGTEMVSMTSTAIDSTNTQHWLDLIAGLRKIYSGKLTYSANSTNNNSDPFENEKETVGFWSALDYAGISAYYAVGNATGGTAPSDFENVWNYWNESDLKQFAAQVGKPLLFAEIGYRSVDGAQNAPWDWWDGGNYNPQLQANLYQAFLDYWNNYSYAAGVYWWDWSTNPDAGGSGNTDYTVQGKPAQQTLTQEFTAGPSSNPFGGGNSGSSTGSNTPASFTLSASANPNSLTTGTPTIIKAVVNAAGGSLSNGIIDIEAYDQSNTQVFQQYFQNQNLAASSTTSYSVSWSPSASGVYKVEVGVFSNNWASNLAWNGSAAQVVVGNQTGGGGPSSGGTGTTSDSGGNTSGGTSTSTPPSTSTSTPPQNATTQIWWPTDGTTISGVQPIKALLTNTSLDSYNMFWQVDGGQLNAMADNQTDYPHKEASIDVSGWSWSGNGPYAITVVSKDASSGATIAQSTVKVNIAH